MHLIIGTKANPLQNIMRDLKRHTAEVLHKALKIIIAKAEKNACLPVGRDTVDVRKSSKEKR